MIFERHSELEGVHAYLSPSNYHWVNYSDDKIAEVFMNRKGVERGTQLHEYAAEAIRLNRNQPRNKDTVNMYINDAIGFKMSPEQPLVHSVWCSGTADAISYRKNVLRIHDLKTGQTEANMLQLKIYAALFCLNYQKSVRDLRRKGKPDIEIAKQLGVETSELHFEPEKLGDIVLRIYQYNEVREEHPDPKEIRELMDIIEHESELLNTLSAEV